MHTIVGNRRGCGETAESIAEVDLQKLPRRGPDHDIERAISVEVPGSYRSHVACTQDLHGAIAECLGNADRLLQRVIVSVGIDRISTGVRSRANCDDLTGLSRRCREAERYRTTNRQAANAQLKSVMPLLSGWTVHPGVCGHPEPLPDETASDLYVGAFCGPCALLAVMVHCNWSLTIAGSGAAVMFSDTLARSRAEIVSSNSCEATSIPPSLACT